jgi:hypothetical protein
MDFSVIPFSAYFDYVSKLGGKARSEQADRWLLQTYCGIDPDADFWSNLEFMGQVNGRNSSLTPEMPCTYEGFDFKRAPSVPGPFYWHFQGLLQEDVGKAMRLAVFTCYLGKPVIGEDYQPVSELASQLTFHHAEVLVKNFTASFSPSHLPT